MTQIPPLSQKWPQRTRTNRRRTRKQVKLGGPVLTPVLAVDAAQGVGCALVYPGHETSQRPRMVCSWAWSSSSYEQWSRKMEQCITDALTLCEQHEMAPPLFVIERAEGATRYGSRGVDMFQGLGRRQGLALAEWRHARPKNSRAGLLVRQGWWTAALDLCAGKKDGGMHREAEARFFLTNAIDCLSGVAPKLRVDVAEAGLMGAAVSLYGSDL